MKFTLRKAAVLSVVSMAFFTSCRNDDSGTTTQDDTIAVPTTYEFTRDGQTSVGVSGQHYRIDMHSQVKSYANSAKEMDITKAHLLELVKNENNPFADGAFYAASDLNGTTKQIWNKTGASASSNQTEVQAYMEELFQELEDLSAVRTQTASNGTPGILGGSRLVNAQGIETIQLMSKSLMGALELDQIMNHYLSDAKLNVDNTTVEEGDNYTAMEHHWDEAFGYTGLPTDPSTDITQGDDKAKYKRFWSGYITSVDGSVAGSGIKQEIYDAFLKGRTAIVNNDMTERDAQRDKIKELMEKACLIRCVHYLREGYEVMADTNATDEQKAAAFHEASEGLGFLYALEFTPMGQNAPATHKPIVYLNQIRSLGFYSSQSATVLQTLAEYLAGYGGFSVEDA